MIDSRPCFLRRMVMCCLTSSLLLVEFAGCSSTGPAASTQDVSPPIIAVDQAAAPLAEGLLNAYEASHPDAALIMNQSGRQEALDGLNDGNSDAAIIFFPPTDRSHFATPIAQDLLVFVTHPDNEIEGLSQTDIADLLTGVVSSWRDVDGSDLPVVVITLEEGSSSRLALDDLLLLEGAVSPTARLAPDDTALQQLVAETPGSIGYLAHSHLQPAVHPLSVDGSPPTLDAARSRAYPLLVPVVFVAPQEPEGNLRQFLDWTLSPEGQQVVRRHMLGFSD